MYIDVSSIKTKGGKVHTRYLLRTSKRENGKVKHETIANLSMCIEEEIAALRLALKHKGNLAALCDIHKAVSLKQSLSAGAVYFLMLIAEKLGISAALGNSREGKLALWQVISRVIEQGSRLSAVRLAANRVDVLDLGTFNEDDLYNNLDWLNKNQREIEDRLFKAVSKPGLYLYDVTSSYLEGEKNELAEYGYNRDGKKGKKQIVVGLLCDSDGRPLSIEVFDGNVNDQTTFFSQVKKVSERFGGCDVTFVGDRGMIKSKQIADLTGHGFHYITAITKAQIKTLISEGTIQPELFDEEMAEVTTDSARYIIRRNPGRALEIKGSREKKIIALQEAIDKYNVYLSEHKRAKVETYLRKIKSKSEKLKISDIVKSEVSDRSITLSIDDAALKEKSTYDGCYVLKTDLKKEQVSMEIVHSRYKDLSMVEWAFRESKTRQLEMRPIYVRKANRTRGHVFVVMLAYMIVRELAGCWNECNLTVEEGIRELDTLCVTDVLVNGELKFSELPKPREEIRKLVESANVSLPKIILNNKLLVATKKSLVNRRKSL